MTTEKPCNPHPDAPHGFDRNGSHMAGHYVCECSGWTPPASIQEELRSVPERSRTTLEAADRIDALEAEVESLQLRNQELAADKEVLLGHMATLRNVTKEPQVSLLTRLVLERMAHGGGK